MSRFFSMGPPVWDGCHPQAMDDDTIRAALRELGEVKLGIPSGHVSVTPDALAARGIDPEEGATWVEAHNGYVDRSEYRRQGLGPNYGKRDVFVRLLVPEASLQD
jgi:hypothetical protein